MPVYEVRPEVQGTTKSKVLHRNQLLPCDFLSPELKTQPMSSKQASERQRSQDKSDVRSKVETSGDENAHYVESDEGETYGLTPEELSVTIPKANVPNQGEHIEAATLVNFHPATEEVFEAGHDEAGNVNNQVTDDVAVDAPESGAFETDVEEVDGHEGSDGANNQVTDDSVVEVSETGVYENETNAENNEAAEGYVRQRPVRNRRPPNMLHYDSMAILRSFHRT